jgi:hypothetical protein
LIVIEVKRVELALEKVINKLLVEDRKTGLLKLNDETPIDPNCKFSKMKGLPTLEHSFDCMNVSPKRSA